MPVIDQWTVLRQVGRSLKEHASLTEQTRARRGIEHEPCPVLELYRTAPDRTIHDVLRCEALIAAHPHWGPFYLVDVIATAEWFYDRIVAAVIQRNAVANLLELHPEHVVRQRLTHLLTQVEFRFQSREAVEMIVAWLAEHHRNAKAFLAQPAVLRHVPAGMDLTDLPAPDHLEIDPFTGRKAVVTGGNGSARVTWRANPGDLAIDYDQLRALALQGPTAILGWLKEQSAAGDQTRFCDIDAAMALDAVRTRLAAVLQAAPTSPGLAARLAAVQAWPDPAEALAGVCEALYAAHLADPELAEELTIVGASAAFLIHDYRLHRDADRACAIEQVMRRNAQVAHTATGEDPAPR